MLVRLTEDDLEILRGKTTNPKVIELILALDRERNWKKTLEGIIPDLRVWPIVASIAEKHEADFAYGDIYFYGEDLMGYRQKEYKQGRKKQREGGVRINGIELTYRGWQEAKPLVQRALDELGIAFDPGYSGLVCKKGEYRLEKVYVDDDGYQFRMFSMRHGANGFPGGCFPIFPARKGEENVYQVWYRVSKLPSFKELVCVEGWPKCRFCGRPMRKEKEQ